MKTLNFLNIQIQEHSSKYYAETYSISSVEIKKFVDFDCGYIFGIPADIICKLLKTVYNGNLEVFKKYCGNLNECEDPIAQQLINFIIENWNNIPKINIEDINEMLKIYKNNKDYIKLIEKFVQKYDIK